MVKILPSGVTFRILWLPLSAMYIFPDESTVKPGGPCRFAATAYPPSPLNLGSPLPATVEITPSGRTARTLAFALSAM
jgi:hypothetical protein